MSDVDNNVIALMVLQEENKQLKEKLEKIEQITNKWISLEEKPNFCMMEIRGVLEKE